MIGVRSASSAAEAVHETRVASVICDGGQRGRSGETARGYAIRPSAAVNQRQSSGGSLSSCSMVTDSERSSAAAFFAASRISIPSDTQSPISRVTSRTAPGDDHRDRATWLAALSVSSWTVSLRRSNFPTISVCLSGCSSLALDDNTGRGRRLDQTGRKSELEDLAPIPNRSA